MASNLTFHINEAMGKAHAIELVHGYIDGQGNDRRCYQDSYAEYVSSSDPTKANFVRFTINGAFYYAPNLPATPLPTVNPILPSSTAVVSPTGGINAASLITDYAQAETPAAAGINDSLLAHTRLDASAAHGSLKVFNVRTLAPSGALVGEQLIELVSSGTLYRIPCTQRIGGPEQIQAKFPSLYAEINPEVSSDPTPISSTVTGIPLATYRVNVRVRGASPVQAYYPLLPKVNGLPQGQLVPADKSGSYGEFQSWPGGTWPSDNRAFAYWGQLPGTPATPPVPGYIMSDSHNEFLLEIGGPFMPGDTAGSNDSPGIFCLNQGNDPGNPGPGWFDGFFVYDYTFSFNVTLDKTGQRVVSLVGKTIDSKSIANPLPNTRKFTLDEASNPSVGSGNGTINQWIQVDARSIVHVT